MLKQVMLGAGGILLAAAIFASSVTPSTVPGAPSSAPAVTPGATPTAQPQPSAPSQPTAVFAEESGDTVFGAPMVSTAPMSTSSAEPPPIITDPDSAIANGGKQFTAKPGRIYPTPE